MDRIDDITDLDSSDDDDDQAGEEYGHSSSLGLVSSSDALGNDSSRVGIVCRQSIVVFGIVAIIVCTSALIGVAITKHPLGDTLDVTEAYTDGAYTGEDGQLLLERAERVMTACSEEKLYEDMSDCQSLCRRAMCCFDDPDSEYSCQDDPAHECAVFFGCEALMEPPGYTSTSYDYDAAYGEEMYNKEYEMKSEIEMEQYQG